MRTRTRLVIGLVAALTFGFGLSGLLAPTAVATPPGQFCGGIVGLGCPEGYVCVDVPGDGCDPRKGGADCAGYCKRRR
jgi:hypothetical protein